MNRLIYRLTFVDEANNVLRFECPTYAFSSIALPYKGIVEYSKESGWSTYSESYVPSSRVDSQGEYESNISNQPGHISLDATTDGWATSMFLRLDDDGVIVSSPSTGSNNNEVATTKFVNDAVSAIGGGGNKVYYGTCSTNDITSQKTVVCSNFSKQAGDIIAVKFSYSNSTDSISLNVNSTGSTSVTVGNDATSATNRLLWAAGATVFFRYESSSVFRYINTESTWYGTSTTSSTLSTKTANIQNIIIAKGTVVTIRFDNDNTLSNTLALKLSSIDTNTYIVYHGASTSSSNSLLWDAGTTISFVFMGDNWVAINSWKDIAGKPFDEEYTRKTYTEIYSGSTADGWPSPQNIFTRLNKNTTYAVVFDGARQDVKPTEVYNSYSGGTSGDDTFTFTTDHGSISLQKSWTSSSTSYSVTGRTVSSAIIGTLNTTTETATKLLAPSYIDTVALANSIGLYTKQDAFTKVRKFISASAWSNNQATLSLSAVKANSHVDAIPTSANFVTWRDCGIRIQTQGAGTITFACETAPTSKVNFDVVVWNKI